MFDRDWARHLAAHELSHGIVAAALGGRVLAIAIGPPEVDHRDDRRTVAYCEYVRDSLSAFNRLCVAVAGEIGEARCQNRAVDFSSPRLDGDMSRAAAAVAEHAGSATDFKNSNCFRFAVWKVEQILDRYSLAIATLALRLVRPPYSIHGDDFHQYWERYVQRD